MSLAALGWGAFKKSFGADEIVRGNRVTRPRTCPLTRINYVSALFMSDVDEKQSSSNGLAVSSMIVCTAC